MRSRGIWAGGLTVPIRGAATAAILLCAFGCALLGSATADARPLQSEDVLTIEFAADGVAQPGQPWSVALTGCSEPIERVLLWVDSDPVAISTSEYASDPEAGKLGLAFDMPRHHQRTAVIKAKCGGQTAERVFYVNYDPPMPLTRKLSIGAGVFLVALLAVIPAHIAEKKGRSRLAYWAFGFLLLPIAILVALLIKPKPVATPPAGPNQPQARTPI